MARGAKSSVLLAEETHAAGFRQAREAKRAELIEDYVELIAGLIVNGGEARQVDPHIPADLLDRPAVLCLP